jgi:hypothetical protein
LRDWSNASFIFWESFDHSTDTSHFWLTNLTFPCSTEAVLGEDGNFVLRDRSNASSILWESFDHPTDTWLPSAKFWIDKVTRKQQLLVSWKSLEDPALGVFLGGV